MTTQTTTAYITKYWESSGILKKEGELIEHLDYISFRLVDDKYPNFVTFYHKGDYFLTEEEAIKHVKEKAAKRITTLQKKIDKINKTWLSDPDEVSEEKRQAIKDKWEKSGLLDGLVTALNSTKYLDFSDKTKITIK